MDFNALTDEEKKFLIQSLPPNKIGNDIYEKLIGKASTTIDFSVLSSEVKMLQAAQAYDSSSNGKPYWAYHDAYQYLERSLNLKFAGLRD